ncbi:methionine ABC transporter ATP-binding protein [Paenibacillus lentus]|uniref:ATP-binding cassette domain-containing protein n=1 Tax=Paenibacillus lentus TaxID=1338368 RepID=A0A3S8RZQ0_9BACL|nr:ATP-binding cassette domain-containing protein [Paenibacillus lentus]AZK48430.1 ATP-binding cassette domain-containing protein [Paenibacillus lentus]
MISLHEVSKSYGQQRNGRLAAVQAVTLKIEDGSIHGIIGPSGAGKSTLLRLMNMLESPDTGRVVVEGKDLTAMGEAQLREARRSIGMIFQQFNLLQNRTVSGNVSIPLELAGMPKKERAERVRECLQFVGLLDKADEYPSALSGGQKQRVAIARALTNSPKVLLCDEPTSSLDPKTTNDILAVLRHVNESLGVTIVIVTHEMNVVAQICKQVSVMEDGRLTDSFTLTKRTPAVNAPRPKSYREQLLGTEGLYDV